MKKIEFHVHTKYSKDSNLTYPFILLMCKLKKINCLAITDHNEIAGALKYKSKLKKHGIDVIVGEEIFTSDGEIIGLYLTKRIKPNLTAKETITEIKEQNGLVYIPHPYDLKRYKTVLTEKAFKSIKKDIDLIEKHNGRNIDISYSKKQEEIVNKNNLIGVVGSDAHTFYELGRNYLLVDSYDKEVLVSNIKKATIKTKKCIKLAHTNTKLVKVYKLVIGGDFDEVYRLIKRKCKRKK